MSARTYGFTCDLLVAINLVDYNGNVIHASRKSNSDLLWTACGGGGGNLGVVSKFTLLAYPHEPIVTTALVQWQGYAHAIDVFDRVCPPPPPRAGAARQQIPSKRAPCSPTDPHIEAVFWFGSVYLSRLFCTASLCLILSLSLLGASALSLSGRSTCLRPMGPNVSQVAQSR